MGLRIGVDIGGSFTDFAVLDDEHGTLQTLKVFSRPDSPGSEVLLGIQGLTERYGIDPRDVVHFTHGTTVGVNAVVQRKGVRLGMITTRHFEDVLDIARLKIPDMYHLMSNRPPALIPRDRVYGVDGRLNADGGELTPVDEHSVLDAVEGLRRSGCEGVVISLLHSYRNPMHEHQVKAIIEKAMPGFFVSCSADVWPIIREYERTLTAVIGGYVQPKVAHYLGSLQNALREAGVPAELKVTKSNGGIMSAESGKTQCVQMILSGTASGVIGAAYIAQLCELPNCMSLDIGGTTADVALIVDGQPQYATGEYIGDYQIHIPSVSVSSIGDGGGSIAWVDEFGVLKVGPESAGSSPGPVCYGRGGTRATITDAFAVLGVLGQADLGYNAVQVDEQAARQALEPLAKTLGCDVLRTAEAIINVSVSGMYTGVSRIVSRFGIDPRIFALIPFGGAGPMLSCHLARALNMREVVVPTTPGVLSALGGLIADTRNDFVKTTYYDLSVASLQRLTDDLNALEKDARDWIKTQTDDPDGAQVQVSADMRYKGQSFEIDTPVNVAALREGNLADFTATFHEQHARLYGHSDPAAPIQVVALRLVISAETPKPRLQPIATGTGTPKVQAHIKVWLDAAYHEVPLYLRSDLLAGQTFNGPAVIAQDDTTTCVLPGFNGRVDVYGTLILTNVNVEV
ncbi:hydantoinase [Pseudomonas syringae]|uniref:Hydantoinase n=1 Tax=Pseudomonas syringae TaxID=317 RepID=A0A1C7YYI1_PSESX|nr:hydantoinase/oxoprolinase family protein [Pseudomonas syringae]OCR22731.1 hydantoinase [Pseudomonas syringae]